MVGLTWIKDGVLDGTSTKSISYIMDKPSGDECTLKVFIWDFEKMNPEYKNEFSEKLGIN